jgi:hypothetical protein
MLTDSTFEEFRRLTEQLQNNEGPVEYQMNLACWLGERAHHLLNEIERLKQPRPPEPVGPTEKTAIVALCYMVRDAARKARDSGTAKDDEEFDRLIGLLNTPTERLIEAALREVNRT